MVNQVVKVKVMDRSHHRVHQTIFQVRQAQAQAQVQAQVLVLVLVLVPAQTQVPVPAQVLVLDRAPVKGRPNYQSKS